MSKLVIGCGYLGQRVARRWKAAGHEVFAVTRSRDRAEQFRAQGLRPYIADLTKPASLAGLPPATTVLFAVGYDRRAGVPIQEVYVTGLRNVLDSLPGCDRLLYISSTGVYGQRDGQWIDEMSTCEPSRAGGRACLAAEQLLASHPFGERAIVLRLAGIYGPGRIPNRSDLLAGKPLAAPSHGYLNLIHVDDAASVVLAAEERAVAPRTYLVSDGSPVLRRDYYRELARLIGAPEPQFQVPRGDSPAAIRATSDKRVRNARLRDELQVDLRYPSYREGLAAILDVETAGN